MFKFKNISSNSMKVVCEEETNLLKKAAMIVESSYEGENIALDYNIQGYNNVEGSLMLYIRDKTELDNIKNWLNGKGILEYNDRVTTIAFFDILEPIRAASIYTTTINFIRSPFWYKKVDDFEEVNGTIINEGSVYSYPIIRLEKNQYSKIDLTINSVRFAYEFPDDESYVEIDCEKANATYNKIFRNSNLKISYEFPVINPGSNTVAVNSGDATIKVKRKDCWL